MTAADRKQWLQGTAAGQLHHALGISDEPDHAAVTAQVEATKAHYLRVYGRELTPAEVQSVRLGAELRSAPAVARETPMTTPELVELVNSRNVGAGWYWAPGRPPGAGVALLQDGEWTGDPAVAEATRRAEQDRAVRAAAARERWANGPGWRREVAGPSR